MKNFGVGVGLRRQHFSQAVQDENLAQLGFFELLSENFMNYGGRPRSVINELRAKKKPMVCHGVGLSLGSNDELDRNYLVSLKELLDFVDAPWFSDHLSFSSHAHVHFHDLIPVIRNDESLKLICDKISQVQDYFKRPFAFENSTFYANSSFHELPEEEFIKSLCEKTGCFLLLDVNNVYVNSVNHQFDALKSIQKLPKKNIIQLHLAGHEQQDQWLIDTHGASIRKEVWNLYSATLKWLGRTVSTLIEWDNNIPEFDILLDQALKAKKIQDEVFIEN